MRGYDETARFREAMLDNLNTERNVNKGPWHGCSALYLLWRLFQEYCELFCAVLVCSWKYAVWQKKRDIHSRVDFLVALKNVEHETADVGNISMFIFDVFLRKGKMP